MATFVLHANTPCAGKGNVSTLSGPNHSIAVSVTGVGAVFAQFQVWGREDGGEPGKINGLVTVSGTTSAAQTVTFTGRYKEIWLELVGISAASTFSATITTLETEFASASDIPSGVYLGPTISVAGKSLKWDGYSYAAEGVESGKVLLCGDSLFANYVLHGLNLSSGTMSGVSKLSAYGSGTGNGTLKYYAADGGLTWTPPSGTEGARVYARYPKNVRIYGGDGSSYVIVGVRPSQLPAVDTSATYTIAYQSSTFYGSVRTYGAIQSNFSTMLRAITNCGLSPIDRAVGGLATNTLLEQVRGMLGDPSESETLAGVERVLLLIGTNDMFGYGDPDPTQWQSNISDALKLLKTIAPVTVLTPPMCGLSTADIRERAWKYMWKPLPQTCINNGVRLIDVHSMTFNTSANLPDVGMVPDQAHPSPAALWYIASEIMPEFQGHRGAYLGNPSDLYDAVTNPTGNLLGGIYVSGTGGTAGTGGVATALCNGWTVARATGSNATITATQEVLDAVSAPWQKITMAGATALTEVCKAYGDYAFTSPPVGTILNGKIVLKIPAQNGLRRIGVRIIALGGTGDMVCWDNDKQTSEYPNMPNKEFNLIVPLDGFVVPSGMTGVRIELSLQTAIGATASVYFRRHDLRPVG